MLKLFKTITNKPHRKYSRVILITSGVLSFSFNTIPFMRKMYFICLLIFATACNDVCDSKKTEIKTVDTYDLNQLPNGIIVGMDYDKDGWDNRTYYLVVQDTTTATMKKVVVPDYVYNSVHTGQVITDK